MNAEKAIAGCSNKNSSERLGITAQVIIALMSVFFSICAIFGGLGWELYASGTFSMSALKESIGLPVVALWLVVFVVLFFLLRLLFGHLDALVERLASVQLPSFLRTIAPFWTFRGVITCSALIIVCWIPYAVILFPGVLTYDSVWSLVQDLGSGALPMFTEQDGIGSFSNHKPVIHTWVVGFFLNAGDALGSQTLGIFAFTLLQMICTAITLALSCCYLERFSTPLLVRLVLMMFCALFPFLPIYAVSCFNDASFSWLYVLWFIGVAEVVRTKTDVLMNKWFVAAFALCGVLLACTKNPGIYLVVISLALLLVVYRKQVVSFLVTLALPLLVSFLLLPTLVYPLCDVAESPSREGFAVFYQMTASYVLSHADEVTEYQRQAIDKVLIYDSLAETFTYETHDPVKTLQRDNVPTENLFPYLLAWVQMGIRHPESYALAVLVTPAPFFCPQAELMYYDDAAPKDVAYYVDDVVRDHPISAQAAEHLTVTNLEEMNGAKNNLRSAIDAFRGIPLLGLLFGLGLWASWMPLITTVGVALRRKALLPAFIPVVLSLLLLLISPWAMTRYALPLIYSFPIMAGMMFSKRKKRQQSPIAE